MLHVNHVEREHNSLPEVGRPERSLTMHVKGIMGVFIPGANTTAAKAAETKPTHKLPSPAICIMSVFFAFMYTGSVPTDPC